MNKYKKGKEMKIEKNTQNRKNLYVVTDIEDIVKDVIDYINKYNVSGFEQDNLLDLKINMIGFRVANLLKGNLDDNLEDAMSAPVVKIQAKDLNLIDKTLVNDIYITYTNVKVSDNKEINVYSIL